MGPSTASWWMVSRREPSQAVRLLWALLLLLEQSPGWAMLPPMKPEKSRGVRGDLKRIILKKSLKLGNTSSHVILYFFFSGAIGDDSEVHWSPSAAQQASCIFCAAGRSMLCPNTSDSILSLQKGFLMNTNRKIWLQSLRNPKILK